MGCHPKKAWIGAFECCTCIQPAATNIQVFHFPLRTLKVIDSWFALTISQG